MSKILEFQKKVEIISKDSTNPFFKSNYFDINKLIEVIKPLLNELGLILNQPLDVIDGKTVLKTVIKEVTPEGDLIPLLESTCILPDNLDAQKMGAAITYFRRYSIQSMLLLQAEDDDGNSAKPNKKSPVEKFEESLKAPIKNF